MKEDCFAKINGEHCAVLDVRLCERSCKFRKTSVQLELERLQTRARLMKMGQLESCQETYGII